MIMTKSERCAIKARSRNAVGILKISHLVPVLELDQLRDKIPEAARRLVTGIQEPAETW